MKASQHLPDALIGYTGFVGSNLLKHSSDFELFNSKNIQDIRGRHFRRVVCAGVSAVKWLANKNPDQDLAGIQTLINSLRGVSADFFTLISTIDVYEKPLGVNEDSRPIPAPTEVYGRNRLALEDFVAKEFKHHLIVRLPALFGPGLKKNVIYDLMNNNGLSLLNPESKFQWYPVRHLQEDLRVFESSGHSVVNMATEPIATGEFRDLFFSEKHIGSNAGAPAAYDMRTKYFSLLNGRSGYFMNRATIIEALAIYLDRGH